MTGEVMGDDMLSFGIEYEIVDESCDEAGCGGCTHQHRRQTGQATLTLVGRRDLIQQAAASVFPHLASVLNPPKATATPTGTCAACGASSADGIPIHAGRCPECIADDWQPAVMRSDPRERALSATQLDALPRSSTVVAGGFPDDLRNERIEWIKLPTGRWQSPMSEVVGGKPGVSATWLATNRAPTPLDMPAP